MSNLFSKSYDAGWRFNRKEEIFDDFVWLIFDLEDDRPDFESMRKKRTQSGSGRGERGRNRIAASFRGDCKKRVD
jgi:hypothetical protein